MNRGIVSRLRGRSASPLTLTVFDSDGDDVIEGALVEPGGDWYPVERGVPCCLRGPLRPDHSAFAVRHGLPPVAAGDAAAAAGQDRTNVTFADKWARFKRYGLEPGHLRFLQEWYCRKLGLEDEAALARFYRDKELILECGPGSGFHARYMAEHCRGEVFAMDITDAAFTVRENTIDLPNCHAIRGDLNDAPFDAGTFDFVSADGVLHHTPDTRAGLAALVRLVRPGGQLFFYVYKRMGPLRRFADEHVRARFSALTPDEAFIESEGFTELGKALSELHATVVLDRGIPVLGIPPGRHDVQRLFYYSVMKCFWNDAFDFATNNMINFDWYHPHHAWQHTREEVEGWVADLGITQYAFHDANPNGLSVLLTRP
jgi:SAM-dependent methyltransferase